MESQIIIKYLKKKKEDFLLKKLPKKKICQIKKKKE